MWKLIISISQKTKDKEARRMLEAVAGLALSHDLMFNSLMGGGEVGRGVGPPWSGKIYSRGLGIAGSNNLSISSVWKLRWCQDWESSSPLYLAYTAYYTTPDVLYSINHTRISQKLNSKIFALHFHTPFKVLNKKVFFGCFFEGVHD